MSTDYVELQRNLEIQYHKNQLMDRVIYEFTHNGGNIDFKAELAHFNIDEKFGLNLLAVMAIQKRANLPTLVGILRHHFEGNTQRTADELERCADAGMMNWDQALEIFIVNFEISAEVQAEIDLYQFPLPMLIRPQRIRKNTQTGYLTKQGSLLLKDNHHEEDICLDHINRMNRIPLSLDMRVVTGIKNQWRNLDRKKEHESLQDFEKRKKAFEKYDRTCLEIADFYSRHGNRFYLTHKDDKRGRTYCQGYHVNYQGNSWNKAVINFADGEII